MKIKKLSKFVLHNFVLFVLSSLMASTALICGGVIVYNFVSNPVDYQPIVGINIARAAVEEEMPIRLYVLNEFYKAGLNVDSADRIISCESKFNVNAINVNKNGTIDAGIFQINSIHKDITLQDRIDYKKATAWAIKKIKHDGGWQAWVCK